MKHNRLFWLLILFLCVSLACNLPGQELGGEDTQKINSVRVSPHTGTGKFSAVVAGEALNGTHTLRCYISTDNPRGDTKFTGEVSGKSDLYQTFPFNESFKFTDTDPGSHSLVCLLDDITANAWSDDFIVTSGSESQATQPPVAQPLTIKSTTAGLALLVEKATSSIQGLFPHHCVPEVNIAADGSLTGSCSVTMYGNSELNTGTLTGKWEANTGKINFHLVTKSVHTYSRIQGGTPETGQTITNTIIDGTSNVVSDLQATGNADWSTDCSSSNADIVSCFSPQQASAKANGTVPWQLDFNP